MAKVLSENWVTAGIKKEIEFVKSEISEYEKLGNDKMVTYFKGVLKGFQQSLKHIEESYRRG